MTITPIGSGFYSWIERLSHKKSYPFVLALILVVISLFFAFPRYDLYRFNLDSWNVTMLKAKDLTNSLTFIAPESFMAKKVFRLTVPVFIRILHLDREGVLAIQAIWGLLYVFFSYKLANRILNDAPSATLVAAGLSFLYAAKACYTDIMFAQFDCWAYFFVLLTLYSRNPMLIFLFATLAAWVDERGALALLLPILFHQMDAARDRDFTFRSLIRPTSPSIAVLLSLAAYIALRSYLTHSFGMHTPSNDADLSVLGKNFLHGAWWFGAFTFLKGFWYLVPVVLLLTVKNKHPLITTLLLGTIFFYCLAAFCTYDLTRSGSYMVPVVFILLLYLRQVLAIPAIRSMTAICFFFSFIFPSMNYVTFQDFLFHIDKPFIEVMGAILRQH